MKHLAPYQIFFPLGLLNAMFAVAVWFVQDLGWLDSPAILIHSRLIVGGFLWAFIVGFLMTAVPRMTGAKSANSVEYVLASILMLGQTIFSWQVDGKFFYANQMLLILFLITYGLRRILKMTKPLPVFFSHVGIAMALALLGTYYHFIGNSFMGIHLYHVGTVLLLVLGIGTRFFSFLSGLPSDFESNKSLWPRVIFHGAGLVMGGLLFLAGLGHSLAYLGLALLSLVHLFVIWRVQRPSNRQSALKYGVRIVAATIPLSFFCTWLHPLMYVTWFHLLFIGCFGLITISVATRVILAHGSYPTDLELKSPALNWFVSFVALSIVFRIAYGLSGGFWKISALHTAATFWIFAILCWCWKFLPKIFKPGSQSKPSC